MPATDTLEKIGYPELCYRCDRTIAKVKTRKGKTMMMDFYPNAAGRFTIVGHSSDGAPIVGKMCSPTPTDPRMRYTCHFDTCAKRRTKRPKGKTMAGRGFQGNADRGQNQP